MGGHDQRVRGGRGGDRDVAGSNGHLSPGKVSLTGSLAAGPGPATPDLDGLGYLTLGEPVQRRGATEPNAGTAWDIHETAAAGVAGPGAPLPHLDAIQRAFGPHDVTGVRAHVGGAAATAAAAIGAEAYATGHNVAFASPPSLHVAAHEAAHVVQQRDGVQLSAGIGQASDPYEVHAEAVAERVVAGMSAAPLLGGDTKAAGVPTVQRYTLEHGQRVSSTRALAMEDAEQEKKFLCPLSLVSWVVVASVSFCSSRLTYSVTGMQA